MSKGIVGHGGKSRRQKVPHVDATQHRARDRAGHTRFLKGTGGPLEVECNGRREKFGFNALIHQVFVRIPA